MIAEVNLDLAAFADKEFYEYSLKMLDVEPIATPSETGTKTTDTSLESLLLLTEDSFEIERMT